MCEATEPELACTQHVRAYTHTVPLRCPATYVLSHSGGIQVEGKKLGRASGTLGSGTLARLLVSDLPGRRETKTAGRQRGRQKGEKRRNGDFEQLAFS